MTTTLELSSASTTCATCPLAQHLDRNRYLCSATHNHHNPVVRGHWEATTDCYKVLELQITPPDDDSWLTEPIGANPDAIFGYSFSDEGMEFPAAPNAYHDPDFDV